MLSIHFVYFVLHKIFYPMGRMCNSTFRVTSAMVSTYGTTIKMLQNTVHRGLILRKVSNSDKDDYKTVMTHMISNYFPHRNQCNTIVSICIYVCNTEACH